MWGNTVAIHSVLKKKKYEAKFSTSSIWKKKSTKTILEKNHKKRKKSMWGNTVVIHNVLKKKTTKLNYKLAPY